MGKCSDSCPRAHSVSGGINAAFVLPSVAGPLLTLERLAVQGNLGPPRTDSTHRSQEFTQPPRSGMGVLPTMEPVSGNIDSPFGILMHSKFCGGKLEV